jgi:flagellar export protein FliJ
MGRNHDRLQSLEQLAGFEEAQGARRLAEGLRSVAREEDRLRQVQAYLDEYARRSVATGPALGTAALLDGRRFVGRLRAAVVQQAAVVAREREQADQLATAWRAARARRLAFVRLRERQAAARREERDRQEQRIQDEIAQGRPARG